MEVQFSQKVDNFIYLYKLERNPESQDLKKYLNASYMLRQPSFANASDMETSHEPDIVEENKNLLKGRFTSFKPQNINALCDCFITHKLTDISNDQVNAILSNYEKEKQLAKERREEQKKKQLEKFQQLEELSAQKEKEVSFKKKENKKLFYQD